MTAVNIKATFHSDIKKVWELVTQPEKYAWRSDLAAVEQFGDKKFTEYSRDGYMTHFTITDTEPLKRWEISIENGSMSGKRVGTFVEKDGQTVMELTDNIQAKHWLGRLFARRTLQDRMTRFVLELNTALNCAAAEPRQAVPQPAASQLPER